MKKIVLSARVLAAAKVFQAVNDVRFYLNGMHVTKDEIASTNGSILFRMPHPAGIQDGNISPKIRLDGVTSIDDIEPFIFNIIGNIPRAAWAAVLFFIDDKNGFIEYYDGAAKKLDKRSFFTVIDGTFPDLDKIISRHSPKTVSEIGLNPVYLSKLSKCIGEISGNRMGCRLEFSGSDGIVYIEHNSVKLDRTCKIYLMPMRIK